MQELCDDRDDDDDDDIDGTDDDVDCNEVCIAV